MTDSKARVATGVQDGTLWEFLVHCFNGHH